MNKFLLASTIILLILSGYLGFRLYGSTHPKDVAPTCTPKCDYSSKLWTGKIDARLAKIMANNYEKDIQKSLIFINNGITHDSDARSVWFPLESLKSYIWDIEHQNCLNKDCHKETLGLRIYFAKYPDASSSEWQSLGLSGLQSSYANHHTIFMIPTYSHENYNIDFDPWSPKCDNPFIDTNTFYPVDSTHQTRARYLFFSV